MTIEPEDPQAVAPTRLDELRDRTEARISLGAAGSGIPTRAALRFNLDHARAREAVWTGMDAAALRTALGPAGDSAIEVHSAASDRAEYLRRPDLGRTLSADSRAALRAAAGKGGFDIALVVADGLSATAVALNAAPLARVLGDKATAAGWTVAPLVIAHQARVALGDWICAELDARSVVVLVGERPGLSAADSLGAYVTFDARPGTPDSARNCVSNIRSGGLPVDAAAAQIVGLIALMMAQKISGVKLKRQDLLSEGGPG
ncbi:ethanolamine ammonia-lyase subunit EutC [Aureimonas altamirensis]|uniref:ethanolamine ammonia-lyase subunit EutC n=1 Tax=Aureimonas altamirensis TaxID=370622 RepID=UPI0025566A14|nr:ethanolamine ammonia-lyase subunit EutC [Aureimonas altamirensis]